MKNRKEQEQGKCIDEPMLQALAFGEPDNIEAKQMEEHLKHCSSCRERLQPYRQLAEMVAEERSNTYELNENDARELLDHTFEVDQKVVEMPQSWVNRLKIAFAVAASFFIMLYGYQQYTIQKKLDRLEQHLSSIPNQIKEPESKDVELTLFLKKRLQNLPVDQQKWKELYKLKESELKEIARYLDKHYPGWRYEPAPEKVEL
jgi:hypothetical protein